MIELNKNNNYRDFLKIAKEKMIIKNTNFNIFSITGIDTNEVKICRILCELLDKNGTHNCGTKFLKLFFKYVLNLSEEKVEDEKIIVIPEYVIENNRRIDIFIKSDSFAIPIEAKINAGDQVLQLEDYYKRAINSPVYYLTLDGHIPSDESKGNLNANEYCCISFENHIIKWLDECIKIVDKEKCDLIEVLKQLKDALCKITGKDKKIMDNNIYDWLRFDIENFKTANEFWKEINVVKAKKMYDIFESIKQYVLSKYEVSKDYAYNFYDKQVDSYSDKNTWPGISFKLPESISNGLSLAVRIEIEARMYIGITNYVPDSNNSRGYDDNCNNLREKFNKTKLTPTHWDYGKSNVWYWWTYIFNHTTKPTNDEIDFRNNNSLYYQLFDETGFENIMKRIYESIDKVMEFINFPKKQ